MSTRKKNTLTRRILLGLASATLWIGTAMSPAYAAPDANAVPTGGTVAGGGVTIHNAVTDAATNKTTMNITQTEANGIINWDSFNVGANSTVNYIQTLNGLPNTAAMTLNRVAASGGLSEIAGHINSIGTFLLINPNGVMFSQGSTVNAAGIIVSTANIKDEDFNKGNLVFDQRNSTNANITMNGSMTAATNGSYLQGTDGVLAVAKAALGNTVLNTADIQVATHFSAGTNCIKLVADGNINVAGTMNATTMTNIESGGTEGQEGFSVDTSGATRVGSIMLRADANADNINAEGTAATVAFSKGAKLSAPYVSVYYNPALVNTVNGSAKYSGTGTYTQKQYDTYGTVSQADLGYIDDAISVTSNTANSTATTSTIMSDGTAIKDVKGKSLTAKNRSIYMLVNDVDQLQAIQTTNAEIVAGKQHGNLGGSYAQGKTIDASETSGWNSNAGFQPIGTGLGTDANASTYQGTFTGSFTGNGGIAAYSIDNLHINRTDKNQVGLFADVSGHIWSTTLKDAAISGATDVGGLAGKLSGTISGSTIINSGTGAAPNVSGTTDVGGLAGNVAGGHIVLGSSNQAVVSGTTAVGGLAGKMTAGATITDSANKGRLNGSDMVGGLVKGTTDVGGLVGNMTDSTIQASAAKAGTYNNGKVMGDANVGGLVGTMSGNSTIKQAYNTNEASVLTTQITSTGALATKSLYGAVAGNAGSNNVGGLVGNMINGTIDTAYNAGKISGDSAVGGLVGCMATGTITKAYNADNNTVLETDGGTAGQSSNTAAYYGFSSTGHTYTYNVSDQKWYQDNSIAISYTDMQTAAPEATRVYNNRLAYRDATVTGTGASGITGGLVGQMAGGTITQAYNAGRVTGAAADYTGALIGQVTSTSAKIGTDKNGVYYVTTDNTGAAVSNGGNAGQALGTDSVAEVDVTHAQGVTLDALQQASKTGWSGFDSSNQNADWIVYNHQTTPLLKAFMTWINIKREYQYDGTVHNLVTSDVKNYYGGAFFDADNGEGKYVNNGGTNITKAEYTGSTWVDPNAADKDKASNHDYSNSTLYKYEKSYMWSPQHGYYTDPAAEMIVTPKPVTVTLTGAKTYGQTALTGATAEGADGSKYKVTYTGLLSGDTVDSALTGNVDAVTSAADTQQKGAGTYTNLAITGGTLANKIRKTSAGTEYDPHNYSISYTGELTVKKADLYVNINGSREYGNANSTGTYTYTEVGKNTSTTEDVDTTNGKLKSWDTLAVTKGAGAAPTLYSADDVYHNTTKKDTKEIGMDANVIVSDGAVSSYTLGKGTNVNGAATATNYNLIFNAAKSTNSHMTITQAPLTYTVNGSNTYGSDSYTYTGTGVQGLKTAAGDTATDVFTTNINSQTQIDSIGAASRALATVDGASIGSTTHVARTTEGKVTNVFSGTLALGTNTLTLAEGNHNYAAIATHYTHTVNPAELTYTVADQTKGYGNTAVDGTGYSGTYSGFVNNEALATIHTGAKVNSTTVAPNKYSVTGKDAKNVNLLDANAAVNREHASDTPAAYTGAITADTSGVYFNDYIVKTVTPGALTITPKDLTIAAGTGTKVYGAENSTAAFTGVTYDGTTYAGTPTFTGLIDADKTALSSSTNYTQALKTGTTVGQYSDAGKYDGQTEVTLNAVDAYRNYNVTRQAGDFIITKRGLTYTVDDKTREYGADNPTFTGTFTGLLDHDKDAVLGGISQGSYTTTTTAKSDVGKYAGDITVTLGTDVSKNYNVTSVTPGTLTITQGIFYYKASPASYVQGDAKIDTDVQKGSVVNGAGKDMTGFLTADDQTNMKFAKEDGTTSASPVGQYAIYGRGVAGTGNYKMADATGEGRPKTVDGQPAQFLSNGTALTISSRPTPVEPTDNAYQGATTPARVDSQFSQDAAHRMEGQDGTGMLPTANDVAADSGAKQAAARDAVTTTGNSGVTGADGGYITREATNSIRFLTLEDTVIQLNDVAKESGALRVDASSRTDGGTSATVNGTGTAVALAGTLPLIEGTTIDSAGVNLVLTENGITDMSMTADVGGAGTAASSLRLAAGEASATEQDAQQKDGNK